MHERLRQHISLARSQRRVKKTWCRSWIRSLLDRGLLPEIQPLVEVGPDGDWQWWERYWITWFRGLEPQLTNHCEGGEGYTARPKGRWYMCYWCGTGIYRTPSRITGDHPHCSAECAVKSVKARGKYPGGAHLKKPANAMCAWCGTGIRRSSTHIRRGEGRYCSKPCSRQMLAKRRWRYQDSIVG